MWVPGGWTVLDEVESTQAYATDQFRAGHPCGVVFAHHQSSGKGRFNREWHSDRAQSLTISLVMAGYPDHPHPWLVGMATAVACASAIGCTLRWPNDLTWKDRKLGGILTELVRDPDGRFIPVVGIGVNIGQPSFPTELERIATSCRLESLAPSQGSPLTLAETILTRLAQLPEPTTWKDLEPLWLNFDATAGKRYREADGREWVATGIDGEGALVCRDGDRERKLFAADALFGT